MRPKCLVCAQDHQTETCQLGIPREQLKILEKQNGTIDKSFVKCINCFNAGLASDHTANWSNCPKRLEYQEIQRRMVMKNPTNKSSRKFMWNREEFPSLPSSRIEVNRNGQPVADTSNLNMSSADLFLVMELQHIWQELFTGLRNCRSKEEQLMTLGNIVIKHLYSAP